MKTKLYLLLAVLFLAFGFSSCEDDSYPDGLPEYEHYYYMGYSDGANVAWSNKKVTVKRTQTDLVKLQVQFFSEFVRNYDAVATYTLTAPASNVAVLGQDFDVVDANGTVIQPQNGLYSISFPQCKKGFDNIYIKLKNSSVAGTRSINIDIVKNETSQFTVGTFTEAYRRTLEIQ